MRGGGAMIHYHGTPITGPAAFAGMFLRGRHALVSFANPQQLGAVLANCQSFALDNGAFSLWSKGGSVDVPLYAEWVTSLARHPGLDWCLIPDKIDGGEADNRGLYAEWMALGVPCESVPVWHMHESLALLDEYIETHRLVALGSSGQWAQLGTPAWWARMGEAMAVACDSKGRARTKLHGLRMLDPEIFTRLPLASADSCNAGVNGGAINRFGMYPHPDAAGRAMDIAARIESQNGAAVWIPQSEQAPLFALPRI
jgi:hypothetical protein